MLSRILKLLLASKIFSPPSLTYEPRNIFHTVLLSRLTLVWKIASLLGIYCCECVFNYGFNRWLLCYFYAIVVSSEFGWTKQTRWWKTIFAFKFDTSDVEKFFWKIIYFFSPTPIIEIFISRTTLPTFFLLLFVPKAKAGSRCREIWRKKSPTTRLHRLLYNNIHLKTFFSGHTLHKS